MKHWWHQTSRGVKEDDRQRENRQQILRPDRCFRDEARRGHLVTVYLMEGCKCVTLQNPKNLHHQMFVAQALMNDAQQQTSAVVDGNDSDVDSDDDVPMGLWGL